MHAIQFDKGYATAVLDAIRDGNPIPTHTGGWNALNLVTVAGILKSVISSQGPQKQQTLGLTNEQFQKMHMEVREAIEETLEKDIHSAIDFVGMLTLTLIDGQYDEQYEPSVKGVVYQGEDGGEGFRPLCGIKQV